MNERLFNQKKDHIKARKISELREGQIFRYSWKIALGVQITGGEDGEAGCSRQARREGGFKDLKN